MFNGLLKKKCDKCGKETKRTELEGVAFVSKNMRYDLCSDCAWDLQVWMHQKPLQFGDESNISVIPEMCVTDGEGEVE